MAIQVGDPAPDFTLPSQAGESITLGQFKGQKPVVLYFYPKDDTPAARWNPVPFETATRHLQTLGPR
jgi:peroxiredoxin Q/BCP